MEISNDTVQEIFDYLNEALTMIDNHSKTLDTQNQTISTIVDYITELSPQDLTEITARIEALEKRETVTPIYTTEQIVVDNEQLDKAIETAKTSLGLSIAFGILCVIMAAYIGFKHYKAYWKSKVLPMFRKREKEIKEPEIAKTTVSTKPVIQQSSQQVIRTTNVRFDDEILEEPPVMEEF